MSILHIVMMCLLMPLPLSTRKLVGRIFTLLKASFPVLNQALSFMQALIVLFELAIFMSCRRVLAITQISARMASTAVCPSFLGQAAASPERDAYLIIGDLSFFYDMNSLRIRHLGPNVKILLINNHGGEEFYYNGMWQDEASDLHTTARHADVAEGWVRSRGIEYFSAHNRDEFDSAIEEFSSVEGKPALLEVFTEMSTDSKAVMDLYDYSRPRDIVSETKRKGKEPR